MRTYPITLSMMVKNLCYRLARKFKAGKPTGIMIHSNGCRGVPAANWPIRWNKTGIFKAAHAFVDSTTIVQALPWLVQGWHAGGKANATHLGVECSEPLVDTPEDFAAAWDRLLFLTVTWCRMFGMTEKNVIAHYEGHLIGIASNHGDVKNDLEYKGKGHDGEGYFKRNGATMDMFRAAVKAELGGIVKPPTKPPVGGAPIPKTVSKGDKGDTVVWLQLLLNAHGARLDTDGDFGDLTEKAVVAFQRKYGLDPDGVVGKLTWTELLKP